MDPYTFTPTNIGLARVWKCDKCHSLIGSSKEDIQGHIKWHHTLKFAILRASMEH